MSPPFMQISFPGGTEFGDIIIDLGVYSVNSFPETVVLPSSGLSAEIFGLTNPGAIAANGTYDLVANNGGLSLIIFGAGTGSIDALLLGAAPAHLAFEKLPLGLNLFSNEFFAEAGSGYVEWGNAPVSTVLGGSHQTYLVVTVVPEPTTAVLLAFGLLLIAGRARAFPETPLAMRGE